VQDHDREVLALLTEHHPLFFLEDLAGTVMGVHDAVAKLEIDVHIFDRGLEILGQLIVDLLRNDVLLYRPGCPGFLFPRSAGSDPRG
jgi:hypothetical protein